MEKRRTILVFAGIFLLTLFVSRFYYQICLIHGVSMEPSYHNWQLTLIDRQATAPQPGTVVAIRCDGLNATIVKRVAAVPGDILYIRNGVLYVNDTKSTAVSPTAYYKDAGIADSIIELKEGQYFVLGDNCSESIDSRSEAVGIVSQQDILGTVIPQHAAWQ